MYIRDRLTREMAEAQTALDALHLDHAHRDLRAELDALDDLRTRMRAADLDLPRRDQTLVGILADMERVVADMGGDCDPAALILPASALADLDAKRDALRAAEQAHRTAADEATRAQEALAHIPEEADAPAAISAILGRYDVPQLAQRHAQALAANRAAQDQRDDALRALTVGRTRFDTLPASPIDCHRSDALAEEHGALSHKIETLAEEARTHGDALRVLSAQIAAPQNSATLPSDAKAAEAHAARDAQWQAHLADLTRDSAAAFEPAMRRVDRLAEARLNGASQLGQLRQMEQDRIALEAKLAQASDTLTQTREVQKQLENTINAVTVQIGLPTTTAAGLASWLRAYQTACDADADAARIEAQNRDTIEAGQRLTGALVEHLPAGVTSFGQMLQAAQDMVASHAARRDRAANAQAEATRRQAQLAEQTDQLHAAETAWKEAAQTHFGDALPAEVLRRDLSPLRELRELEAKRVHTQRSIDTMRADQTQFTAAITDLAGRHGVTEADPHDAFARLQSLADETAEAHNTHARLMQEQARRANALDQAKAGLADIARTSALYAGLFPASAPTDSLDALREAVVEAHRTNDKRARMAELAQDILDTMGLPDLDAARAELDALDAADVPAELDRLRSDLDAAEAAYRTATAAHVTAQNALAGLSGDDDIAELVQRKSVLEMQIEDTALSYLELSMGINLAEEAIRRYRDDHRGDMIRAVQTAFAGLTNGAYPRLTTQVKGATEVLLAMDATGASKPVSDMSKGTRFQLYLALRAAAYEQMVQTGINLPFFCDDIFETFDEDRTRAACKLMERIGRQGQAIYLTHHRHVLDIAQAHCETPPQIHMIGS